MIFFKRILYMMMRLASQLSRNKETEVRKMFSGTIQSVESFTKDEIKSLLLSIAKKRQLEIIGRVFTTKGGHVNSETLTEGCLFFNIFSEIERMLVTGD